MTIRTATKDELGLALAMLRDSALWLRSKGLTQWESWLAPEQKHLDWLAAGFATNEYSFVEEGGAIVGLFRLQYADELFWGNVGGSAGYLHSFTTVRNAETRGLGARILDLIERRLKKEGIPLLRLDCWAGNPRLVDYYKNNGFLEVGRREFDGYHSVLFEKALNKAD